MPGNDFNLDDILPLLISGQKQQGDEQESSAPQASTMGYQPISDKQVPFAPYTSKSIEDIAAKHKVEAGQVKDIIKGLQEHPENMIGTGELGGAALTPELWNAAKTLRKQGFSIRNIADYLGLGHTNLERAFTRGGEKGTSKIAQPWSPSIAGHTGDPEYEKALSDWMRNQDQNTLLSQQLKQIPKNKSGQ